MLKAAKPKVVKASANPYVQRPSYATPAKTKISIAGPYSTPKSKQRPRTPRNADLEEALRESRAWQ